ncbi:GSCOCG00013432001-RA-CDS, partial [Cotesia congregata]
IYTSHNTEWHRNGVIIVNRHHLFLFGQAQSAQLVYVNNNITWAITLLSADILTRRCLSNSNNTVHCSSNLQLGHNGIYNGSRSGHFNVDNMAERPSPSLLEFTSPRESAARGNNDPAEITWQHGRY